MEDKLVKLLSVIKDLRVHTRSGSRSYNKLRSRICGELERFAQEPTNMDIVKNINELLIELELLEEGTNADRERAKTNIVVVSSRTRRTHYAAYVAGRFADNDNIGDDFKCWMHNAAAHGALSLAEAIDHTLSNSHLDLEVKELVKVFRNGAFEDAARFVDLSIPYFPGSPLTEYNQGKLCILSKNPEKRRYGIDLLKELEPPTEESRMPELQWHLNNFESFSRTDGVMKSVIRTQDPDALVTIEHVLNQNRKLAAVFEETRTWDNQTPTNKVAMTSIAAGLGALGLILGDVAMVDGVKDYLNVVTELLASIDPASNIGDGGLASTSHYDLVSSVFGDGGIA